MAHGKKEVGLALLLCSLALFLIIVGEAASDSRFTMTRIKYGGGGDWYNGPTEVPNLMAELLKRTTVDADPREKTLQIMDDDLYLYPIVFITGHGNIKFKDEEVLRLRTYLLNGGFMYADDDYGMDKSFRREIKRVFPDKELAEVPFDHPIYRSFYDFPGGVPKIHEHDGGPPHAYGIFHKGRMIVYYTYNTNISDGWDSPHVHNDPPEKRELALRMGVNIIVYALTY